MRGSRRQRLSLITLILLGLHCKLAFAFIAFGSRAGARQTFESRTVPAPIDPLQIFDSSSTSLNVWWYGGSESGESLDHNADSCELVAVRIERTSANSRRIYGEISVPAPLQDVWAILTDYNRLSIHVPNLVESRIERVASSGEMGDGQFQCRLYQKGAQKIVGFEFGASVTMDMRETLAAP